jgi:ATP-dependent helicase/DNAse subunit B
MSLTLVTGPANAAKAGEVFARYRRLAVSARTEGPLLVVPTFADAEHYARELAANGVVVGTEVVTFSRLMRIIGTAAGLTGRPLGPVARARVVRAAVSDVRLEALAASGAAPGFATAAGALFDELERSLVTPQRFIGALRHWRGDAYTEELGALYGAYRRRLERLGAVSAEGYTWAALDALRTDPQSWGRRPVLWYGFDDLTRSQFDAVETLAGRCEAEVVVALPWEAGRAALAGCARTVEDLRPLADEHLPLPEMSEHYDPGARPALHHLERGLFESDAQRIPAGDAVRLLEAGGERAEAELVSATVVELLAAGTAAEDIAVVVRDARALPLIEQVMSGYGVPVSHHRRVPFAHTRLGAGLLALVRAARPGGSAADVVTWLRTPGKLAAQEAADRLEAVALRTEAQTPSEAIGRWSRFHPEEAARARAELGAIATAAGAGGAALVEALAIEAETIWTAPHIRRAAVLSHEDAVNARAAAELRSALRELRGLAERDPRLAGSADDVVEVLDTLQVREGEVGGGVLLADPLAIRARRFRAVVVCGLQDGEFPRRPTPDPFLPDEERRSLAAATDLRLPLHEDVLARERSLFYACVSRPQETLVLAFRSSSEEGDPLQPSPFVEDVRALFDDALWEGRRRRLLADVVWEPREAPTPHELRRAYAAARCDPEPGALPAPRTAEVLAAIAARDLVSARELETYAGCGVRWVVEHLLKPAPVEPDNEWMRRGTLEHKILESTLRRLRERMGSARLAPETIESALGALDDAVAEQRPRMRTAREQATLRGVAVELARVLRFEAEQGAGYEPEHLEWSFGDERWLDLGSVRVGGRVDRIDVQGDGAIVRDYKRRGGKAGARWEADGQIQVALYAMAAKELLGLEPVAALYQPLIGSDLRPRGLVCAGELDDGVALVDNDVVEPSVFDALLDRLREQAAAAGAQLREGRVVACPDRCRPNGTCAYPGICRAGEGSGEEE